VVVVVVVVVVVAVLSWNLVVLAQSMHTHTHTHTHVRSETVDLPLLVTAAAGLAFSALPPLLGSASSLAASSMTGAGLSWICPAWLSLESADKHA